jgi:hypothetical protein
MNHIGLALIPKTLASKRNKVMAIIQSNFEECLFQDSQHQGRPGGLKGEG